MYSQILCKLFCHHTSCKSFSAQQLFLPVDSFLSAAPVERLPFSVSLSFQPRKNYPACFYFWWYVLLAAYASTLIPFDKGFSLCQYWLLHSPALLLSFQDNFRNL